MNGLLDLQKFSEMPNVKHFRFILALATFVVFIVIPMTFNYSTSQATGAEYEKIIDEEYSEFLGIDIFAIVSLIILAATSKQLAISLLFLGALGLVIYVLVLTQDAKNTSKTEFTSERALQAKMGFFTDGIIVGLTGFVVMDYLRNYLSL